MNPIDENQQEGLSLNVGHELSRNITIHKNVDQEIIITTADKINLVLIETRDIITSQRDWWTPFGLFASFITTLCTAGFKETVGINKDVWQAIFILMTIGSGIWLIISVVRLVKYWGDDDMKKIISQIKLENNTDRAQ